MILNERFDNVVNQWYMTSDLAIKEWDADSSLLDSGADSLDAAELTALLEKEFGFVVEGFFDKEMTFGEIWNQIKEMKGL